MANPFSINFNTPDTRGIFNANEGRKLADRESIQTAMKDLTSMALESRLAKDESMTPTQKAQERFRVYSGFGDTQRAAAAKSDLRLEEQRALDQSRLLEGRAYAEGQARLTRQRALETAALDRAVTSYQGIATRLDGLLKQRSTLAGSEFAISEPMKQHMEQLNTTIDALRVKQRELYGRFPADLQGQLVAPLDMAASPTSEEDGSAIGNPTTRGTDDTTSLDGDTSGVLDTVGRVAQSLFGRNDSSGEDATTGATLGTSIWSMPTVAARFGVVQIKHNTPVTVKIKALVSDLESHAPNSVSFRKARGKLIAALREESAKTNPVRNPNVSGRKRLFGQQPDLYNISASEWINERLEGSEFDPEPYKDPATGEPLTSTDKNWAMLIG